MIRKPHVFIALGLSFFVVCLGVRPGWGQSVAEFYKGRNITIVTATGAGSGYGVYGRVLARHLRKHIPGNPKVIMQFMPGGGGSKMLNYLYNVGPKDGTYIGFPLKYIAVNIKIGRKGLKYDPLKFNYLGSLGPINAVFAFWKGTTPAATFAGMKAKQVVVGSTGKSSGTYIMPTLMNNLLGTKFKVVTGYKGLAPIELAMERGEVHGRAASWDAIKAARSYWIKDDKIVLVAQTGLERNFDLPNLPTMVDLAPTKEAKDVIGFFSNADTVGWLLVTPPGVPANRVAALRKAMVDTAKDEAFIAEAEAKRFHVTFKSGPQIEALVAETMATTPELMARIKTAMGMK